jgi:hypothetical protein
MNDKILVGDSGPVTGDVPDFLAKSQSVLGGQH